MLGQNEIQERIRSLDLADPTLSFSDLVVVAGLDHGRHLRFADWSGISFAGCDLRGFDFTGARLIGCDFTGATISKARFEGAEIDISSPFANLDDRRACLRKADDWEDWAAGWLRPNDQLYDQHLDVGAVFTDAPFSPEMVVVPRGAFEMGSDSEGRWDEGPVQSIAINHRLAVGRFPVTFREWDFASSRAHDLPKLADNNWGREDRPVIYVSHDAAIAYCEWLSQETGFEYRLLSESEWEFVCRSGTTTDYCFGTKIRYQDANFAQRIGQTTRVGTYPCNAWGLFDLHGNVWEWCSDAWGDTLAEIPRDGAARTAHSDKFVARGGSWFSTHDRVRCSSRLEIDRSSRDKDHGFRVARVLE